MDMQHSHNPQGPLQGRRQRILPRAGLGISSRGRVELSCCCSFAMVAVVLADFDRCSATVHVAGSAGRARSKTATSSAYRTGSICAAVFPSLRELPPVSRSGSGSSVKPRSAVLPAVHNRGDLHPPDPIQNAGKRFLLELRVNSPVLGVCQHRPAVFRPIPWTPPKSGNGWLHNAMEA